MLKSNYTHRFPPSEILELETLNDEEFECAPSYEVTLVIPTRNEAGNIETLLVRVQQAIVAEALKDIPTRRLRDPRFNWWQRLPATQKSRGTTMQLSGADD